MKKHKILSLKELEEIVKKGRQNDPPRDQFREEVKLLGRFLKGGEIKNREENGILEKYHSLGFVHFSFQFNGIPSAKLTGSGKSFYYCVK